MNHHLNNRVLVQTCENGYNDNKQINNGTLTIEESLSVVAIPKKKRPGKKLKRYRVSIVASGYPCSERQLHKTIFESAYIASGDGQISDDTKGVVTDEE